MMENLLTGFLKQFDELSRDEVAELSQLLTTIEVNKNTILVKEGQSCGLCYFVLKGCMRQYLIDDGIEKTVAIYTENEAINYYTHHSDEQIADTFLISMEDAVLLVGHPEKDAIIYQKYPALIAITRKMIEKESGKQQKTIARILSSNAEQRYIDLLNNRPDLLQRIPQHIIASYLGVTAESLSRIRKRIAQREANRV